MKLEDLKKEISYQWRVQSFSKNKPAAQCVAYIDSRDVQKILDEVSGPENWQDDYKEAAGMLFAGIGIKVNDEWIWKWDTGSESNIEKEKGHVSDSFKRAAVKWGVGRFLYDLDIKWVKADAVKTQTNFPNVIDDNGNKVWDLTEYINGLSNSPRKTTDNIASGNSAARQEPINQSPVEESLGICPDCGQPNKRYPASGKIGCSVYCWKNKK